MVFVRFPFEKRIMSLHSTDVTVDSSIIRNHVISYLGCCDFRLYYNGKELDKQELSQNDTIHVTFPLPGGKGGFGSMLRAIGAQIEKTTNREACRDLSGRRLRDINEEQRLKKWIAKEAEREAEKIQRRKARIERLKTKPKHNFVDFEYEKEISELPERIDDALTAGMQKVSKRPVEEGESSKAHPKKKCVWLDEDLSSSGSDSEACEKIVSSGDVGCSGLSNKNKKFLPHTLSSEASGSEASNSCSSFETKPLDNVCKEVLKQALSVASTGEQSSSSTSNVDEISDVSMEQTPSNVHEETDSRDNSNSADLTSVENAANSFVQKQEVTEIIKENAPSITEDQGDESSLDLLAFGSVAELEALGLDRLKSALMTRGLKCGGNISDRAERLWRIRGLQPDEYPANLLAKKKK